MSASQDGWTTSPTGTNWGVSSSAKLVSKPSRQTANQSVTSFEQTLRPFDQTMSPFEQTKRPSQQPPQPSQLHLRPVQQDIRPSQRRGTRRHEPLSQRQPRSTQQNPEAPRRHSQHEIRPNPDRHETFARFLDPQLAPNHRQDAKPRRQPLRPSRPLATDSGGTEAQLRRQVPDDREHSMHQSQAVLNHRSSGSPVQPPRPSQKVSMGFARLDRHRSDKSASSGSTSSTERYIELSPARRREIISRVTESVQHVMASMLSNNSSSVQWKPKLRKKDISYFMDESSVKPGQTRFCCVSHTHATVDEIMKLFVVPDAESVVRNNRVLSDSLLEARILSVLRRPTKERPMNSMYVRYSSYQAPGLMVNREVCLAVATDIIHQADGSTIGYCLWDSIDDPEFAEASKKPGLESSIMFRSGFFLRRSGRRSSSSNEHNYTKIVYMVGLEPGGWAPGLTARLLMERFGDNLARLCSHFRRKNLDSRTFVMKTQWMSKLSAKSCKECNKPFQVLSNRVNCHSCGHVVCRTCASKEQVELHAVGLVPMYICFLCLDKVGLPVPASAQNPRSNQGRRRLQSDTATIAQITTQLQSQTLSQSQPNRYQQSRSVVESDLIEEEEDDDTDTGEWAFTPSGVPIRPYRMK